MIGFGTWYGWGCPVTNVVCMISRNMWARILLLLALTLLAACSDDPVGPIPSTSVTVEREPTRVRSTPQLADLPAIDLPTRDLEPTPTFQLTPTATATATATITVTIPPSRSYPNNWRLFGDQRFGLQLAAPESWVNLTGDLRHAETFDQLGPKVLLLADSPETGRHLLNGDPLGEGMFVFAFFDSAASIEATPAERLFEFVVAAEIEDITEDNISLFEVDDGAGAFVEIKVDPLNIFPINEDPLQLRLLSLVKGETSEKVIFLLGASENNDESYDELVDDLMGTISLPPTHNRVRSRLGGGEPVHESLEKGIADLWPFSSANGNYATITLTPEEGTVDLTLNLIDPDGNILASIDNGYAGDIEVLTDVLLPADGNYVIEVSEFFNEAAGYELNLLLAEEPQFGGGGLIRLGQEIFSELPESGEHLWAFEGTAGQAVTMILTSLTDQLDVILEFRGPDGSELILLDEGFAGDPELLTGFEISVTGEYVILVRGFAGHGGPYTLSLDEGGESTVNFFDAGDLQYGESGRETLREDEAHAWFFEGEAGDEVTIEVSPLEPNMDMDIWLLDPELGQLATKDEFLSGESEIIEQSLPLNGQYLLLVREFFGEPGEYEVALEVSGGNILEIAGSISYSQTITGTLPPGKQVGWTFKGRVDEIVDINVSPVNSNRDLVIVLLDPTGYTATSVDGSLSGLPESLEAFRLTSDGQWMIVIQEFFNEGSDYELQLFRQVVEEPEEE